MKKFMLCLIVSLLGVSSISCQTAGPSAGDGYNTNVLRINCATTYSHVLSILMRDKDMLAPYLPEGVTVEWSGVISSEGVRDGIVSGDIDISALSAFTVVSAIENDLPMLLLSGNVVVSGAIYAKNPEIQTVADLLNANGIYVNAISSAQSLMLLGMAKDELGDATALTDKFVPQEAAVSLMSFENSDDVDCLASVFPNTLKAAQIEGAREIADLTPYGVKYDLGNYYVVNEDFYNNNPALIEAFRKAQQDALDYMIENPEEAGAYLGELWGLDAAVITEEVKSCLPRLEVTGYDSGASLLYEAGVLSAPPKKLADMPNYEDIPK